MPVASLGSPRVGHPSSSHQESPGSPSRFRRGGRRHRANFRCKRHALEGVSGSREEGKQGWEALTPKGSIALMPRPFCVPRVFLSGCWVWHSLGEAAIKQQRSSGGTGMGPLACLANTAASNPHCLEQLTLLIQNKARACRGVWSTLRIVFTRQMPTGAVHVSSSLQSLRPTSTSLAEPVASSICWSGFAVHMCSWFETRRSQVSGSLLT